jgi:hypothetical protein
LTKTDPINANTVWNTSQYYACLLPRGDEIFGKHENGQDSPTNNTGTVPMSIRKFKKEMLRKQQLVSIAIDEYSLLLFQKGICRLIVINYRESIIL